MAIDAGGGGFLLVGNHGVYLPWCGRAQAKVHSRWYSVMVVYISIYVTISSLAKTIWNTSPWLIGLKLSFTI